MDSTFTQVCEDAAARWEVPALAVGTSGPQSVHVTALGCSRDTRFRIASITKPITAAAAVGRLDLEAPAPGWAGVTVADLLAHLSGYDCELGDLARFGDGDDALGRLAAELPECRRWIPAREVWSYANTGYWLAGHLLALQAGCAYEEVISEVAAAAGLTATAFDEPDLAGSGPGTQLDSYPRARRPSGGLVANVDDLLRFGAWLLRQRRLDVMRQSRGKPVAGVYGLGLAGERVGGVEVWGHGGSYGGFQSSFLVVPERAAVFAGLSNSGRGKQALREIEDAWLEAVLGARRRVPEALELDDATLAGFEGRYVNDGTEATVSVGDPGLVVTLDYGEGAATAPARAIGPATFAIVAGDYVRDRFDFPRPGFARFGSRLSERVG